MTRISALAFAAVLASAGASFAYDWTAPDGDEPNVPTVGEQSSMKAPAGLTFSIKKPVGGIYDMTDQDATIDGKPDFESD